MTMDLSNLTESEAAGIQPFTKPAPGSWTESLGLGTGPVDYRDCYDPEFFELEKDAVFRRSWLYMGRAEQLPRPGTYFTKELPFLKLSALIVRGMDGVIRAFHNVCSHRGNKLVWDDYPDRETAGACRAIACKYHGWRFDLEGEISYVHNAPEFFDLKAEDLALPKIHCEEWAGFVFVNLEETPRQALREFLTPGVEALESYPFGELEHTFTMECEIESNWKLLMDAFQELYHVPYVHSKMNNPGAPATGTDKVPFMMPTFQLHGKHRLYTSGGPHANAGVRGPRPLDELFRSSFYGPIDVPDYGPLGDGINPGRIENWGLDSWQLYPNLDILIWGRGWYLTYEYWPVTPDRHRFIWKLYFPKATTARERLAQEHCMLSVREFAIQDAGAVEAMQAALRTGARDTYHMCDQEVLVRHFHHLLETDMAEYRAELAEKDAGR